MSITKLPTLVQLSMLPLRRATFAFLLGGPFIAPLGSLCFHLEREMTPCPSCNGLAWCKDR
ncbi:hypothetical protein BU25DRAFT_86781 [Macroventuria anomochaeta]|uniref:Uncharacterized protein n=1 Tax=Macroventuria anomochaeta TaxID=301207 RepID=A0ACB6SI54_9PLEO|nr:uncharacterized protein BU25DRAFT_86781 [Macroventuria anomochaeta]KAF2632969.1 hypothetical protein BU25DRAFT_86781 [Macroventuria anomochaeta]